jgi:microcystin degradation protein MlrC
VSRRYRVAICGLASESCTFSPLDIAMADTRPLVGAEILQRHPLLPGEPDVEFVPLLRVDSVPGGRWQADVYERHLDAMLTALRDGGPWDGVLLDLHGALYVIGLEDAEAHQLAAVRAAVGPDALLAASYDLHGNVSTQDLALLDILTALRTAPHADYHETRARAARLLIRALRAGVRPARALVRVPLTLPGECAMTLVEPARALYARIPDVIGPGVWDASLLLGYTWADEPRVGASAVAIGDDLRRCESAALSLADAWWSVRHQFGFGQQTGSVDECIAWALAEQPTPVFLSDAGDNVTGGGVGDVPFVLERLLAHGAANVLYASLADAPAVAACRAAGVGATAALAVGGKLDRVHGAPLDITARVLALHDTAFGGETATVQVQGITLVLTSARCAFTERSQFAALGLEPRAYRVVVVKLGYLHDDLQPIAARSLLAFSPGCLNPDITQLEFARIRRPIYPLDRDMAWQPAADLFTWPPATLAAPA